MNILSQILNYETKNFYINMAIKKIKCKLIDILNSILNNLSTHRYIDFFLNLQKEINEMVIELIVSIT